VARGKREARGPWYQQRPKEPRQTCTSSKAVRALKARLSKAQGEGCEAAETLGGIDENIKPCKGDTATNAKLSCVALTGLNLLGIRNPGFQSPLSRAPPPWALLRRAFSAKCG